MKTATNWIVVILTVCLLAGCYTTGLSPREAGANNYSQLVYGLYEEQESTTGTPARITFPIRLAVAQIGETAPPDKLTDALREHRHLIADIMPLPLAGVRPNQSYYYGQREEPNDAETIRQQAKTLRKLGQQMGADYILVIGGNIDSTVEALPSQILDLTIVPGFFIPSQRIEMTARAGGVLIHADSGRVECLLTTHTKDKTTCPSLYVDQERTELAIAQRSRLCEQIADELAARLISRR